MEMDVHVLLPIGSIVNIKKTSKKIMITGTLVSTDGESYFTYSGCLWPEGIIDSNINLLFDVEDIEKVLYKAPSDLDEFVNDTKVGEHDGG